jgi:tRNA modification GTPase
MTDLLPNDTIVAISTPPGRSGIGVVRVSGPASLEIARTIVRNQSFTPEPNRLRLMTLRDPETGDVLDQALVTYFRAPNSFTGEDVVELSCHGAPVVLRLLVDAILRLDARLAEPGEFTLRALANGRMNLSQAEAVRDLIDARTNAAARQASRQLRGELSHRLQPIKNALLDVIVQLESSLEFVEDDLPPLATSENRAKLLGVADELKKLAHTFAAGRLLREGLRVTLVGRPNVGKSSLFNRLLETDRAIVTEIPGTTRDTLTETINLEGVAVELTDTAGLRASSDVIETIGVERTKRATAEADLVVLVLDTSQPLRADDKELLACNNGTAAVIALNKSDLPLCGNGWKNFAHNGAAVLRVSAKTGAGIASLRAALLQPFESSACGAEELLVTNARHHDLLNRACAAIESSLDELDQSASEELILVGLHNALRFLGEITGETAPAQILQQIFSTFCIGK